MLRLWLGAAVVALAFQFPDPWRASTNHSDIKRRDTPDQGWTFCRLMFSRNRSEWGGNGWMTDYPLADRHFQIRFSELTTVRIAEDKSGDPVHWVVDPKEAAGLSRCPWMMASDVGTLVWLAEEVPLMRDWLAKGGFLWVDDFWGPLSWAQWTHAVAQVMPRATIAPVPADHPMLSMVFRAPLFQVSNLNYWLSSGGKTSERGDQTAEPELWGAWDREGHLAILMTFNTDIADTWEREKDDPTYFVSFAGDGYAFGINVLAYAMSH